MSSCNSMAGVGRLLLAVVLCLCAAQAYAAAAATVLFSHGSVSAVAADGQQRALTKGAAVFSGDTIVTAADGRVQMRFSDGGLVSLMPGSKFVVAEYQAPTSGSDGSLVFKLVEGGLRTLTGSIGHKNHDDYKLKTSVATLGIRGTQFVVVMDGDVMRIHVGHGKVFIYNKSGKLFLIGGENGIVIPGRRPEKSDAEPNYVSSAQTYTSGAAADGDSDGRAGNTAYAGSNAVAGSLPAEFINGSGTKKGEQPANSSFAIASVYNYNRTVTSKNGGSVPAFVPAGAQPGMTIAANPPEVHVDNGLVWGRVDDQTASTFHYYVWGNPATNVPLTGMLSYSLANGAVQTEDHGAAMLDRFDLKIKLGGVNSPSFKADVEVSGIPAAATTLPSTVTFNMDYFQSGVWNDAQRTAFEFHARELSTCTNPCQSLNVSGILSSSAASEAGVAFHYATKTNDGNLEGVAVLDKQP